MRKAEGPEDVFLKAGWGIKKSGTGTGVSRNDEFCFVKLGKDFAQAD